MKMSLHKSSPKLKVIQRDKIYSGKYTSEKILGKNALSQKLFKSHYSGEKKIHLIYFE